MAIKMKKPSHPGDVLKHLYLDELQMSEGQLAKHLGVPRTRIERLTKKTTGMTPDTAFRLAKFFGTSPEYWINMQINYDLAHTHVDVSHIEPLSA
ncbi:MAG: HigA family addiction module antidote protein [Silicimonas sp.]|nr:HigA family addiction module antidote protein [Silicimonas sp.]RZW07694.1 MAG: addiction module antidote protein, HigA family [Paracoccaceae bacterium]